ncbi:Asp-tRNA(Asn)/Glu-tRNA(Gln) amidotransferase subunit GatB [Patescibacteria group bacterium]|nr:Asp-tRNA(Asn)/Glu-tRNA(Gln) amidotransferase subunit GatB [Patescibacteria group bacterium]
MKYKPTIGLEIHAELKTKTKMFCDSLNDSDEKKPNVNVCPICMAHPGTLPVINKEAVRKVLITGKALNGKLSDYSRFDRKNYFYPDLPKGYQISQYKYPLVEGGDLNGVKITRIHLEEDTGRLIHGKEGSLVDFNRAGVPLMELVTEPDIKSGEQASKFAKELQLILRYLDVSDADMEKGQMRVEANISLKPTYDVGEANDIVSRLLGTKVEIKNLNSFKAVEQAINYEIERQTEILDEGGKIIQETRGWNENKGITFSQREKEESHDYRYFPEPDLPSLDLRKLSFQLETKFPSVELPQQKRERFKKEYKLKDEQIEIIIQNKKGAEFFEEIVSDLGVKPPSGDFIALVANYFISDLQGIMKEKLFTFDELLLTPENFAELISMISKNEITSRVAKDVLRIMIEKGGEPSKIIEDLGLRQISDESAINKLAEKIIKENPIVIEDYKKGKETAMQFLVGQGMKETKGSINPESLKIAIKQRI